MNKHIHSHLHCLSRLLPAGLLFLTVVGPFQSGSRAELDFHCRHGTAYGRVRGGRTSRVTSSFASLNTVCLKETVKQSNPASKTQQAAKW
ncbi:hypothetical protein B0H65DRAFT_20990 [Neurospora tetraspora]|uniref:Secreted protein n=1 Tax=Neurospora tetraspora TaxID=94610 RepID=A0AAE0JPJ9_9PEZI|nr:hypothetical protein B0H65DRAFT_20990 [Neurospora tetraspora]